MPTSKGELVLELIREVRDKQDMQTVMLTEMKKDIAQNTEDLADHIEGVMQNRVRIEKLEQPRIFIKTLTTIVLKVGGLAGAIFTILKVSGYI